MKKKGILLLAILCCLVLVVGILAACNETASFTITFDTQGGSNIAEITVGNGQVIGEVAPPTKQCARFVGFALDAGGERMWNLQTDTVSADITLYAIWEDTHTWGEWETLTEPTCTAEGAHKHICEVCGKEETENISKIEHDFIIWEYDENHHWKICSRCGAVSEKTAHVYAMTGKCECGAIAATPASEFTFTDLGNNTWRVDGYSGSDNDIVIPSRYNGGKVISIGREAFLGQLKLTSVIIPDSVTSIALYAFRNCTRLTSVSVPDSVTSIGVGAFSGCSSLESITIPFVGAEAGKTSSDTYQYPFGYIFGIDIYTGGTQVLQTYYGSSASSTTHDYYYIPSTLRNVTITGGNVLHGAFENCSMLTSVDIGSSAINIAEGAFSGCSSLESITIPFVGAEAGKTSQDTYQYPFGYIFGTTSYTGGTQVLQTYYGSSASSTTHDYYYIPSTLRNVTITGGNVLHGAFENCSMLTSVDIGSTAINIAEGAFSGCSSLESITIPFVGAEAGKTSSDTYQYPFGYIFGTASYTGGTGVTQYYKGSSTSSTTNSTYYIPSSLREVTVTGGNILRGAFDNCSGLTSVTIGAGVTSIGSSAFDGCSGLTSVYYTGDIAGWCGISGLGNIMSSGRTLYIDGSKVEGAITIPDGVTYIGEYAFYYCDGLTSITIPDSVTSIGWDAFYGCYKLVEVYNKSSLSIAAGTTSNGYIGYYAKNVYTAEGGSWLTDTSDGYRFLYDGTNGYLIGYYGDQAELTLPASFTAYDGIEITEYDIYDCAFAYCPGLTSVTIPDSVTSIGSYAFEGCTGLTSVTIGDGVTSIGSGAFRYCTNLTSVTIPDSVTSIGSSAFSGCSGLERITIPFVGAKAGKTSRDTYQYPFGYIFGTNSYTGGTRVTQFCYSTSSTNSTYYYIPSSLREVTVTGGNILRGAFYNCTGLASITIGDGVTSIGDDAFEDCTGLTSVTIGDSVTSIGSGAFRSCSGLASITIPDSVTSIGGSAFRNCTGLTEINWNAVSVANFDSYSRVFRAAGIAGNGIVVTFGESVEKIPASLFSLPNDDHPSSRPNIKSVTIGSNVTSIGSYAFSDCTGLTSIYYEGDIAGWCGISGLGNIMSSGRTLYIDGSKLGGAITIPDGVTSIGNYAFYKCTGLTSVTIPDSVTSIGSYAFEDCTGLTSVTIGDSVTSIGSGAFCSCSGLTSITIPDSVTSIGDDAFYCSGLKSIYYEGDIAGWCGISGLSNIMSSGRTLYIDGRKVEGAITIPDSVTSIGDWAFYDCNGLTSVTIGEGVTSIGGSAFYNCTGLTSVTIGDGVKSIGSSAFRSCSGLTSVTIPDGVTSIGDDAFYCSGLKSIYYEGDIAGWCGISGLGNVMSGGRTLYIDGSKVEGAITVPDGVEIIPSYAFSYQTDITSVSIPDSVTSIGSCAFYKCSGLTSVTIPDSVTSIGSYAFYKCTGLTSITIPDSVTSIGDYAFAYCTDLTSVAIGAGVTSIGYNAFYNCSGLTSVTFEETSGWFVRWVYTATSETDISAGSLSDKSTAAEYLSYKYDAYYWNRYA